MPMDLAVWKVNIKVDVLVETGEPERSAGLASAEGSVVMIIFGYGFH